ncbi:MAG: hypothetical protein Q8811_02720, partial [Candidatus Phytoplasma australasiaticum]|nr:hypothetical protein [Candidatus Phytoplasma australasiaticum]
LKQALKLSYTKRKLNETLEIINLSPREIYIILNELNKEDINNLSPKQIYQILKTQTKDKMLNVSEEWENINNIINNADYETIKKLHLIFVKYKLYNDEKILLNEILRIINWRIVQSRDPLASYTMYLSKWIASSSCLILLYWIVKWMSKYQSSLVDLSWLPGKL